MKENYINIIISELDKLTEEQLYKVLVLVKNTAESEANKICSYTDPVKPSKNKMLTGGGFIITGAENPYKKESKAIKDILLNLNFTGGYGIMEMVESSDINKESNQLSTSIYFCVPDVMDCKIEISSTIHSPYYVLMIQMCKTQKKNAITAYNLVTLEQALENIAQITKK